MHLNSPWRCAPVVAALALALPVVAAEPASSFSGRWITESGNLEVDIAACGDAWCGTVTRVLANRSMSAPGQEMAAADGRPALGMRILSGLTPSAGATTLAGEIYNRENGKTYSVRLSLDGPGRMVVRPYVLLPLFGRNQVWQRRAESAPASAATAPASAPSSASR